MAKLFIYILLLSSINIMHAQYSQNELQEFCEKVNENIELIRLNHQKFIKLEEGSQERYNLFDYSVLTPFLDEEFEVIEPFTIDENGLVSMKIKYLNEEKPFIYAVKGNLKDLNRVIVDIYFILEFEVDSLICEYSYLNSEKKEVTRSNLLHLGVDQVGLVGAATDAGIPSDVY